VPIGRSAAVSKNPAPRRNRAESFSPRRNASPMVPALRKRPSWPEVHRPPERAAKQQRAPLRRRILFYHHSDPHYGFTNFSKHPVIYKNKRYPTSEHLFQSFKVSYFKKKSRRVLFNGLSSKIIVPTLLSIFVCVALSDRVLHYQKHAAFSLKCGLIGWV
jgi:hypothetical protein